MSHRSRSVPAENRLDGGARGRGRGEPFALSYAPSTLKRGVRVWKWTRLREGYEDGELGTERGVCLQKTAGFWIFSWLMADSPRRLYRASKRDGASASEESSFHVRFSGMSVGYGRGDDSGTDGRVALPPTPQLSSSLFSPR